MPVRFVTSLSKSKNQPSSVEITYKNIDKTKYNVLLSNSASSASSGRAGLQITQDMIDQVLQQYEYIKYMVGHVPSDLTTENMSDLIHMQKEKERERFLRYLFLTESRKLKDRQKKAEKSAQYQQFNEQRSERTFGIFDEHGELSYRLWGNTLMSRINARCISHLRTEPKLRYASLFGQKLIIDLDYDELMTLSECRIQVRHIVMMMVNNLSYSEPYDIYFTNCDHTKPTMKSLEKYYETTPFSQLAFDDHFLSKSYLDAFNKDQLVYLTPNATEKMQEYNHDDIYIVGGFLDKSCLNKPASHMKATREGIRQYRLPLDEHVVWGSGSSKHLCIMHMVGILNSLKEGNDWSTTLQTNIPKRKLKDNEVVLREEEKRRVAYLRRKLSIEKDNFNLSKLQQQLL